MSELGVEVTQEANGLYSAKSVAGNIFTQADAWDALSENAQEAVRTYCFDGTIPERISLYLVRDGRLA